MSALTTRVTSGTGATVKNAPLTNTEIDTNFINLNVDKVETADAVSANTASKVVKRDSSGNFSAGTITAALTGNATTATTATNLAGGSLGSFHYQSALDTTATLAPGTSGQVIRANGAAAPTWMDQSSIAAGSALTAGTATNYNGVAQAPYSQSIKSGFNVSGGGTISVDASGYVNWTTRFITISNGRGTNYATSGYFDITAPGTGIVITGVGGAANVTTTAAGIPLTAYQALYYILPLGSANTSIAGNFRVMSYTADQDVPYNWIQICVRNGDDSLFYFPQGLVLGIGQSSSLAQRGTNFQINSLGVGTAASGTAGQIRATNTITAFYSDRRLKTEVSKIENALDKLEQLTGIIYTQNKLAETFGYNNYEEQVGLYAQDVQKVQPQAVKPAPFDIDSDGNSKSGDNYLTVQYDRLIPLIVEAIKELRAEVKAIKG
jgi:hypothetical protein